MGYSVIICGRRIKKLEEVASTNDLINFFCCDVADEDQVVEFANHIGLEHGYIDVLINCAAHLGAIGRFDQTDSQLWRKTIDTNLFGTYLVSKHLLPFLLKSDVKKIVNFSGGGAFNSFPNYSAYAVSKAAVVRLSENMADELAELGVKVNCVAPGFVATEIHQGTLNAGEGVVGAKYFKETKDKLVAGSVPIEVSVSCVKFLISDESNGLSGKTISASFDRWDSAEFRAAIHEISASELYTMRRINIRNLEDGNELREKLSD
jgi:NAD(P)-dependent dehydrogenase (short-subunit alcohol dehydrogenase family)